MTGRPKIPFIISPIQPVIAAINGVEYREYFVERLTGGPAVALFYASTGEPEEAYANARLFVAAQELLAALKEARSQLAWTQDAFGVMASTNVVLKRVDKALAAAEEV